MQIYNAYNAMNIALRSTLQLRKKHEPDHAKGFDPRYQVPLHILHAITHEIHESTGVLFTIVASKRSAEVFDIMLGSKTHWAGLRREGCFSALGHFYETHK